MKAFYKCDWQFEGAARKVHNQFDETVIDGDAEPFILFESATQTVEPANKAS